MLRHPPKSFHRPILTSKQSMADLKISGSSKQVSKSVGLRRDEVNDLNIYYHRNDNDKGLFRDTDDILRKVREDLIIRLVKNQRHFYNKSKKEDLSMESSEPKTTYLPPRELREALKKPERHMKSNELSQKSKLGHGYFLQAEPAPGMNRMNIFGLNRANKNKMSSDEPLTIKHRQRHSKKFDRIFEGVKQNIFQTERQESMSGTIELRKKRRGEISLARHNFSIKQRLVEEGSKDLAAQAKAPMPDPLNHAQSSTLGKLISSHKDEQPHLPSLHGGLDKLLRKPLNRGMPVPLHKKSNSESLMVVPQQSKPPQANQFHDTLKSWSRRSSKSFADH